MTSPIITVKTIEISGQLQVPCLPLVSALVHEVRNPLANINLSVEMLAMAIKDPEMRIYLDIIMRSTERINNLVCELLNRPAADEVNTEKHSIHQLMEEVLELAADRILLKHITIRKDYASGDFKIAVDKPRIIIALTNIIINAVEAMTPGAGELHLVTKATDDGYMIRIEDNGCGISKVNLQHIFKPHFTGKTDGLGVGLAATNEILRSNNVGIHIESILGKGTQFILVFKNKSDGFLRMKNASHFMVKVV